MKQILHAAGILNAQPGSQPGTLGQRLLLPLAGGMLGLLLILTGGLYWLYTKNYERQVKSELASAVKLYQYSAINYKDTMSGIVELLSSDSRGLRLMRDKDRNGLLALYGEAFEKMKEACGLTYLLFADENRRVLERIHDPGDRGDVIQRKSFSTARRDNSLATTLDAGSDGRLSLRVVSSVMLDGGHVGFIEVGTEMDHALAAVTQSEKVDVVLALDKRFISEDRIRPDEVNTEDEAFWVDPDDRYFLYTTFAGLDEAFADVLLRGAAGPDSGNAERYPSLDAGGTEYLFTSMPLEDSTGQRLGELFILYDTASLRNELVIAVVLLLGAFLFTAAASRLFIVRKLKDTAADLSDMHNAIKEGELLFEHVFAESGTGFIVWGADANTVLSANSAALSVFGVSRAEEIDPSLLVPLSAGDPMQNLWQTPLAAVTSGGGIRYFEQTRFFAGHTVRLECTALREVTDGVLLQSENRAHIVFLQTVINQLPGWVCIKDDALRLTQYNETFKTLFGEEESGPDAAVPGSKQLGEDMDLLLEGDRKALRTGLPVTLEITVPGVPGGRGDRTYVVTKQRFTGRDGRIHILSTGNDITERVQVMEQLMVLHKKAEAGSMAKTRFLARMSHELRTPLNTVLGMSYLALKLNPGEQLGQYLEKMQQSAEGLLAMIADILNFSEMETGEAVLAASCFDLREVLETIGARVRSSLGHKAVEFSLEVHGVGGKLVGDAARIRQAVCILCDNAVKFTESGSIRLLCTLEAEDAGACTAHFSVEDTGAGIVDEQLEHLFDSFHQVDGSVTRQFGGIGMGLALAGQTVALLGGKLAVESVLGKGSRFFFSIPLHRQAEEEEAIRAAVETEEARGRAAIPPGRILVVEDNDLNQMIILELLELDGLQVTVVDNGRKAVDIVKEQPFDLVLMDLQMPVMGGLEAARLIRESELGKDIMLPIVALTANAQDSDRADCVRVGMNGFLSKPIDVAELYATLRRWLSGKATHGESGV